VKIAILPKATYRFNGRSIKVPISFFTEKSILKFTGNQAYKRPQIAKCNPEQKE
jgi:hypothetical protein